MESPSVTRLREYLQFPSVHPNPDYSGCISWIKSQAQEIGLEFHIEQFPKPSEFVVWLTWIGTNPELPSILLNSHMDVVPVDLSKWSRDPFGAEKDSDGNIYARGSQDMKSVGVAYLEAIRFLKSSNFRPLRTIHVSFVPDEEVGGYKGMGIWVGTVGFKSLNIGFALDEGVPSPELTYYVFNGERNIWQFRVTAIGKTGHASIMFEGTASEKLHYVISRLLAIRTEQLELLKSNPELTLGDVTSINLTMLEGGLQANVVPPELSAVFDMRITPAWSLEETEKLIRQICSEAGPGVTYKFLQQFKFHQVTSTGADNIWWTKLRASADRLGLQLKLGILPGATDIRYLREMQIPAIGFTPFNQTPILLHDHNEFLNETIFLQGIAIYEVIIKDLALIS